MKQLIYILFALTLFASCTKDNEPDGTTPSQEFRPTDGIPRREMDLKFGVGLLPDGAGTRTVITEDGKKLLWGSGDKIHIFTLAKSRQTGRLTPKKGEDVPLSQGTMTWGNGTNEAIFTSTVTAGTAYNDYCVFYPNEPAGTGNDTIKWQNSGTTGMPFLMSRNHLFDRTREISVFNDRDLSKFSVLAGIAMDQPAAGQSGTATVPVKKMYHQVAYYKLDLRPLLLNGFSNYLGATIEKITFTLKNNIVPGDYTRSALWGTFDIHWDQVVNGQGIGKIGYAGYLYMEENAKFEIDCTDMVFPTENNPRSDYNIYFATLPAEGEAYSVEVKTVKNRVSLTYRIERTANLKFEAGKCYSIDMNNELSLKPKATVIPNASAGLCDFTVEATTAPGAGNTVTLKSDVDWLTISDGSSTPARTFVATFNNGQRIELQGRMLANTTGGLRTATISLEGTNQKITVSQAP